VQTVLECQLQDPSTISRDQDFAGGMLPCIKYSAHPNGELAELPVYHLIIRVLRVRIPFKPQVSIIAVRIPFLAFLSKGVKRLDEFLCFGWAIGALQKSVKYELAILNLQGCELRT
jgi:hypothetical protein